MWYRTETDGRLGVQFVFVLTKRFCRETFTSCIRVPVGPSFMSNIVLLYEWQYFCVRVVILSWLGGSLGSGQNLTQIASPGARLGKYCVGCRDPNISDVKWNQAGVYPCTGTHNKETQNSRLGKVLTPSRFLLAHVKTNFFPRLSLAESPILESEKVILFDPSEASIWTCWPIRTLGWFH